MKVIEGLLISLPLTELATCGRLAVLNGASTTVQRGQYLANSAFIAAACAVRAVESVMEMNNTSALPLDCAIVSSTATVPALADVVTLSWKAMSLLLGGLPGPALPTNTGMCWSCSVR